MASSAPASSTRIIIQGRKVEVTPAIRDYCEDKITKAVSHFEGQIKEVNVKLSVRGGDAGIGPRQQRTEITTYTLRHGVVRAEDVEDNLYASIDLVCDKVRDAVYLNFPVSRA
jgi:ribosomal subunit interface protein